MLIIVVNHQEEHFLDNFVYQAFNEGKKTMGSHSNTFRRFQILYEVLVEELKPAVMEN